MNIPNVRPLQRQWVKHWDQIQEGQGIIVLFLFINAAVRVCRKIIRRVGCVNESCGPRFVLKLRAYYRYVWLRSMLDPR